MTVVEVCHDSLGSVWCNVTLITVRAVSTQENVIRTNSEKYPALLLLEGNILRQCRCTLGEEENVFKCRCSSILTHALWGARKCRDVRILVFSVGEKSREQRLSKNSRNEQECRRIG